MARLDAEREPCCVVIAPEELPDDPHAQASGLFEESVDPVDGRVRRPRHPARFGGTRAELGEVAPALGQHTDEILGELGLGADVARLRGEGAVS